MFKKGNLFALFALFVLISAGIRAQDTTAPKPPKAPLPTTGSFQVFTNEGGSYLGVQMQEVNKDNFSKFGLREVRGVAIEKVSESSPAAQAGLQNGDVIVRFEGEEVSGIRKLQRLIGEVAPDHQTKITVLRDGKERDFTVTMGKRPGVIFQNGVVNTMTLPNLTPFPGGKMTQLAPLQPFPNAGTIFKTVPNGDNMVWSFAFGRKIGVGTAQLTKQLGEYFGVTDGKGILVTSVNENSPAAKGGLKAGDVIIEADGKSVANSMELMKALNSKEKGVVTLTVIRDKNRQTVTVEPEAGKPEVFEFNTDGKTPNGNVITVTPQIAPFSVTGFPIVL